MLFSESFIAVIDVGHGNSAVLYDHKTSYIVDCGLGSSLMEFLEDQGIFSIDSVLLSHSDQDHIAGLVGLLSSGNFTINSVYVNSDSTKQSKLWDDLMYELSQMSVKGGPKLKIGLASSTDPFICGNLKLKTLGPSPYLASKSPGGYDQKKRKITSNSISASFQVLWKDQPVVYLAGDVDQIALDDLFSFGMSLETPVLVYPHHGGKNGNSDVVTFAEQICNLTKASTIIFSLGRNEFDNPKPEIIKVIRQKVPGVRISCTQLSKHCAKNLPETAPNHLLPVFSRGKILNQCCGGTFIIKLENSVEFFPRYSIHQKFIKSSTSTPLCN